MKERMMTFLMAISLSNEDLEKIGFAPQKFTPKVKLQFELKMGELFAERDFIPLMKRAAKAVKKNEPLVFHQPTRHLLHPLEKPKASATKRPITHTKHH